MWFQMQSQYSSVDKVKNEKYYCYLKNYIILEAPE